MTETTQIRIELFELWLYRKTLRISYMSHTTIAGFAEDEKGKRTYAFYKGKKTQYLDHIISNQDYGLRQLIIESKINGKRTRKNVIRGLGTYELFRAVTNKIRWNCGNFTKI